MQTAPLEPIKDTSASKFPPVLLLLCLIAFVAHFLFFSQFGLYEDDYIYTLPSFGMGFSECWHRVINAIIHPIQARPLNHAVRNILYALTLQGTTLELAYLTSWLFISINAFLLYRLVKNRLSPFAAAVAALIYLLHPADNARQIIMHQTDIHFGAFLFLISLNLFLDKRPILAWLVGAASLINYESFYLPLLIVPLVISPAPIRDWKKSLLHLTIWIALISSVAGTRFFLGEDRTTAAAESPFSVVSKIAKAVTIGPKTSLQLLVQRPIDALIHLTPFLTAVTLVIGACSYLLLITFHGHNKASTDQPLANPKWVIIAGLVGLCITYTFAFRPGSYPPILSIGRLTALHAPGILCTAIAAGAALYWLSSFANSLLRHIICLVLAICFGLMGAFSVEIQRTEYAAHWKKQQLFWNTIFSQAGDISDNEIILVDVEGSETGIPITPGFPRFGTVNYPPQALKYFANLPPEWKHPPRVYGLWTDTPVESTPTALLLKTPPYFGQDEQPVLRDGNFIFFRVIEGNLQRIVTPVNIRGHMLNPKQISMTSAQNHISPSLLYQGLFQPHTMSNWATIRKSRNYPQ